MWNNQYNSYNDPSPPQFPGAPGFPTPEPTSRGFNPVYAPSYGPPSGYGPPPGHPPSGYGPPSESPRGFPQAGGYAPPPGQPHHGHYAPPSGPPPGQPSHYAPPSGPPPGQRAGYPGQQYHQQHQQGGGYPGAYGGAPQQQYHYGPPSGPPPPPPVHQQNYGPQFQNASGHTVQPYFQYSQCTGKKKALCIGINYFGQDAELKGCINDAHNMVNFLTTHYGYKKEDIVILTDDQRNPQARPTHDNMIRGMQWLVQGASPNDSLFFHYSGHGGQTKDLDGDEDDGYDEVIYPEDFKQKGHIVDDLIHDTLVKPLPAGCRLTAIFDSCHSGSALDLPYIYSTEGKIKEPNLAAEAGQGLLSAVTSYARGDMSGVLQSAMGLVKTVTGGAQKAERIARATKTSPADCISWSGCKDSQTSADTQEAGRATGAMSYAFITALSQNKQQSYQSLLVNIRNILQGKYSQKPQLSSSHPMDTNLLFIC